MKFWQCLMTAALTTMLIEGDKDNHGLVARLIHDGACIALVWWAWWKAEQSSPHPKGTPDDGK